MCWLRILYSITLHPTVFYTVLFSTVKYIVVQCSTMICQNDNCDGAKKTSVKKLTEMCQPASVKIKASLSDDFFRKNYARWDIDNNAKSNMSSKNCEECYSLFTLFSYYFWLLDQTARPGLAVDRNSKIVPTQENLLSNFYFYSNYCLLASAIPADHHPWWCDVRWELRVLVGRVIWYILYSVLFCTLYSLFHFSSND